MDAPSPRFTFWIFFQLRSTLITSFFASTCTIVSIFLLSYFSFPLEMSLPVPVFLSRLAAWMYVTTHVKRVTFRANQLRDRLPFTSAFYCSLPLERINLKRSLLAIAEGISEICELCAKKLLPPAFLLFYESNSWHLKVGTTAWDQPIIFEVSFFFPPWLCNVRANPLALQSKQIFTVAHKKRGTFVNKPVE